MGTGDVTEASAANMKLRKVRRENPTHVQRPPTASGRTLSGGKAAHADVRQGLRVSARGGRSPVLQRGPIPPSQRQARTLRDTRVGTGIRHAIICDWREAN
jgi:hypothetical protein